MLDMNRLPGLDMRVTCQAKVAALTGSFMPLEMFEAGESTVAAVANVTSGGVTSSNVGHCGNFPWGLVSNRLFWGTKMEMKFVGCSQ